MTSLLEVETVNTIILIKQQTDPYGKQMKKRFTKYLKQKLYFNNLTFGRTSGGEGGYHPLSRLRFFFLDDKTSAPDVFSICSFIPRALFETSLVTVNYYCYEIWRHKQPLVKPFCILYFVLCICICTNLPHVTRLQLPKHTKKM